MTTTNNIASYAFCSDEICVVIWYNIPFFGGEEQETWMGNDLIPALVINCATEAQAVDIHQNYVPTGSLAKFCLSRSIERGLPSAIYCH